MRITKIHIAGKPYVLSVGGRTTIVLPIKVMHRSARKQIIGPATSTGCNVPPVKVTAFQLALVRGHRWLAMLESGEATSHKEIAESEAVDPSLVSRLINLTTLAPEIVAAILEDTLASNIRLLDVAIDPAVSWDHQRRTVVPS